MIVVRFKVRCRPEKTERVKSALRDVIASSRELPGVISFDVAQDLSDDSCFVATEVFEDRAALDRQEAQAVVASALEVLGESIVEAPEATIYHVASSEPYGE
jgi:quinol monooxygenase YgiN